MPPVCGTHWLSKEALLIKNKTSKNLLDLASAKYLQRMTLSQSIACVIGLKAENNC